MKGGPYSIRQHIAWLTLIPLLLMAAGLGSFFLHVQFAEMDRDLLANGQMLARQLAASSEYGVFSNNREFLANLAKKVLREADVKAVVILNQAAEVMVAAGDVRPPADSAFRSLSNQMRTLDNGNVLWLYQPVLATQVVLDEAEGSGAPQQIGAVILEMSWQETSRLKSDLLRGTLAAIGWFLMLVLVLVYLATRRIVDSIRKLSEAVAAIGAGDLRARVTVSSRISELVSLGDGINHMTTELQHEHAVLEETHRELDQVNRNLERTVAERTSELSASLDNLQHQKLALQESEARLRLAIEAAPIPILIHVDDGSVLTVNRAFTEVSGYALEDVPTMTAWAEKAHGELSGMALQKIIGIFQAGASGGEYRIRCRDGRECLWEISSVKLGQIPDGRYIAISIAVDITERRQQEQRRIEKERQHREVLVREVHHRIKNNLQSVAGLLQRELGKFMELDPRLETAITQINVIAVVHGLQGVGPNEAIRLGDVADNICKTVSSLTQHPVRFITAPEQPELLRIEIKSDEAVSVALVLNELILNAVKHSPEGGGAVTATLCKDGDNTLVQIRNPLEAVPGFDIVTGKGLGTGLSLVRSLLPEQGAELRYMVEATDWIVTSLKLSAPVLSSERPVLD